MFCRQWWQHGEQNVRVCEDKWIVGCDDLVIVVEQFHRCQFGSIQEYIGSEVVIGKGDPTYLTSERTENNR